MPGCQFLGSAIDFHVAILTIVSEVFGVRGRAVIAAFRQKSSIFQRIAPHADGRRGAVVTRLHWVALQLRSGWARRL
jgi:hypothetical protein